MRKIHAGDPLTQSNVHLMPAVRRGQNIQLIYQTPGLVLKTRSIARGNALVGEHIKVRVLMPAGRRGPEVRARVVGEGLAVLEPNHVQKTNK